MPVTELYFEVNEKRQIKGAISSKCVIYKGGTVNGLKQYDQLNTAIKEVLKQIKKLEDYIASPNYNPIT